MIDLPSDNLTLLWKMDRENRLLIYLLNMVAFHSTLLDYQRVRQNMPNVGVSNRPSYTHTHHAMVEFQGTFVCQKIPLSR